MAQLLINEFAASNASGGYYDAANDNYPDWIEIHNTSASAIDLSHYYLTDDLNDLDKWRIPAGTVIAAHGYQLFIADDRDTLNHTSFKLNAEGESIGLSNGDKVLLDSVVYLPQNTNISMGRLEEDPSVWAYYPDPTPNARNSTPGYTGKALAPLFSIPAGFYDQAVSVEIETPVESGVIRYTLDGSKPNASSTQYTGPIHISSNTVINAFCYEEGKMTSDVVTHTYFIGENSTLPVFSFSMPPDLVSSFPFRYETPTHVEYFEKTKNQVISQDIGVRKSGLVTIHPMRSFSLYARSEYGDNRLDHRFFKDKILTSYKNLFLRNGGYQDYSYTYLRDGLISSFAVETLDLEYQAYQPAVVYKNGTFLALMNMREKMNEFYVENNRNIDKDSIDLLEYQTEPPVEVLKGDTVHYTAMMDFIENSDLTVQENMEYLETQMDVKNYLDYYILQIYCANADWPDKNAKIWRPRHTGGKWRWMVFDVDYGYGFRFPVDTSMYTYLYDLEGPFYHNRPWVTVIFRKIMENEDVRNYYLRRFCALLNTAFHPDRALHLVDSLKAQIEPEIGRHIDKWGNKDYGIPSMEEWQSNCEILYDFAIRRPGFARRNMMEFYGLEDTVSVGMRSVGGTIYLDDLAYCRDSLTGMFFTGIPLELKAVPDPGYEFVQWLHEPDSPQSLSFTPVSDTDIEAVFNPVSNLILEGTFKKDTVLSDTSEPYIAGGHLVIPAHTKVTIEEGVQLIMPEGCNIYVYGILMIHGTETNPVEIDSYDSSWGAICLHHATGRSEFNHLILENASTGGDPEIYPGAISAYHTDINLNGVVIENVPANPVFTQYSNVWVDNCHFQSEGTCDLINVKYADSAIVENSVFMDSRMLDTDAIDFDDVKAGIIRNNQIHNLVGENSDGIDIGEGTLDVEIYENLITNCGDKGISIGQASSMKVYRNVIYNCNNAIAVKDFGTSASISNNTLVNNTIGVSCYEKNLGSGAGTAHVLNTILASSDISPVVERNDGKILVEYSLSDKDLLYGTGNRFGDPELVSPQSFNFELEPTSPCINSGSPDSPLDQDGSRADIGAYYVSTWPDIHADLIINEYYSNTSAVDPEDWIEIYNKGKTGIELSGWYLKDDGNNFFRIPENTTIDGNSYIILCKDTSDFKTHFLSDQAVVGNFDFSLGNSRDVIALFDQHYNPVKSIAYDEDAEWPDSKDKKWLSVALIDTSLAIDESGNWRTGYKMHGTPGYSNIPPRISDLYLNEFSGAQQADFTDNFGEYEDWIELYNGSDQEINFGGLFLTDDLDDPALNRVRQNNPDSTTIEAGGYRVLFADRQLDQGVLHLDFKISAGGEALGLVQLVGLDTVVLDQVIFGDLLPGFSLGRRTDGGAPWERQAFTPGWSNLPSNVEIPDELYASVYPNPASDLLYVSIQNDPGDQVFIQVVNALGQVVLSESGTGAASGHVISMDVSPLLTGIYFVKVRSGNMLSVKRIVITR